MKTQRGYLFGAGNNRADLFFKKFFSIRLRNEPFDAFICRKVGFCIFAYSRVQRLIPFKQFQRDPAGRKHPRCLFRNNVRKRTHCFLRLFSVKHTRHIAFFVLTHAAHGIFQFIKSFARPCGGGNNGNAELQREFVGVYMYSFLFRFVHQVQKHNRTVGKFKYLQNKVKISFKTGRVNRDYSAIAVSEAKKITRYFLFRGICKQRVRSRNIDKRIFFSFIEILSHGVSDGLSRPVARVLFKSRQRIEHRTFSDIRVSRKRNDIIPAFFASFARNEKTRRRICQAQ